MPGLSAGKVARPNAGIGAGAIASLALALLLALAMPMAVADGGAGDDEDDAPEGKELLVNCCAGLTILIGAPLGVFGWLRWQGKRTARAWGDFAARHGFALSGGDNWIDRWIPRPIVTGEYRGRPLVLESVVHRAGKHSSTLTRLTLTLQPAFAGRLELYRENFLTRIGADDIEIHDVEFDPEFIVKCSDPALPGRVLQPFARRQLRDHSAWNYEWDDTTARALRGGLMRDAAGLDAVLEILSGVADELTRYAGKRI